MRIFPGIALFTDWLVEGYTLGPDTTFRKPNEEPEFHKKYLINLSNSPQEIPRLNRGFTQSHTTPDNCSFLYSWSGFHELATGE